MGINQLLKLILLLCQMIQGVIKQQHQMERERRVAEIHKDPVAEWNRRFGRVPMSPQNPSKLPPDTPDTPGSNK